MKAARVPFSTTHHTWLAPMRSDVATAAKVAEVMTQ